MDKLFNIKLANVSLYRYVRKSSNHSARGFPEELSNEINKSCSIVGGMLFILRAVTVTLYSVITPGQAHRPTTINIIRIGRYKCQSLVVGCHNNSVVLHRQKLIRVLTYRTAGDVG